VARDLTYILRRNPWEAEIAGGVDEVKDALAPKGILDESASPARMRHGSELKDIRKNLLHKPNLCPINWWRYSFNLLLIPCMIFIIYLFFIKS